MNIADKFYKYFIRALLESMHALLLGTVVSVIMPVAVSYADTFGSGTNQFSMDFVYIGNPGNPADTSGYGAVGNGYLIGKYEVTIDQFTKAWAADSRMGSGNENWFNDGTRTVGVNAPATMMTWPEAMMFCNWLTTGDAYMGAYSFDTNGVLQAVDRDAAVAAYGRIYVLPTVDEWYKAAYYKPVNDGTYSIYANGSDSEASVTWGTTNGWNYRDATNGILNASPNFAWETGYGAEEQNGTYDMMGNLWEFTESAWDGTLDDMTEDLTECGGGYPNYISSMSSTYSRQPSDAAYEGPQRGFRVAVLPQSVSGHSNIVITAFDGVSGELVFDGVMLASNYFAESTTSLTTGSWVRVGGALDTIAPNGIGAVTCSVPVGVESIAFYGIVGELTANMAFIPSGNFEMGDYDGIYGNPSVEEPVHTVYIDEFYMDRYAVTKALWDGVYNWAVTNGYSFDNAGSGKDTDHPVHSVNWYDAVKWCNARSEREGRTPCYTVSNTVYRTGQNEPDCDWSAAGYRLPTEAEWEKAARGGDTGYEFPWGDTINHTHANYTAHNQWPALDTSPYEDPTYHPSYEYGATPYTSPVGDFPPNGYGLYDMVGNVREWCWDWIGDLSDGYYAVSPTANPHGPSTSTIVLRKVRSTSWDDQALGCRNASRKNEDPTGTNNELGFRCVLPVN